MIFGPKFVWFHIGKMAGNTTRCYFGYYSELVSPKCVTQYPGIAPPPFHDATHGSLNEAKKLFPKEDFDTKDQIINFRKIENWIPSFNYHIARQSLRLDMTDKKIREQSALGLVAPPQSFADEWISADKVIEKFVKEDVKHFIRVEYLYDDFIKVFKNYGLGTEAGPKSEKDRYSMSESGLRGARENVGHYPPINFTEEEKRQIYDRNPLWTSIQRSIY